MIGDILRSRIEQRLNDLGINAFEAERRANFKKGYVNDLLTRKPDGTWRKEALRDKALPALARALECEVDFLVGQSDRPNKSGKGAAGVELEGILEAGAWRSSSRDSWSEERIPVTLDPRFDPARQMVFLVRDDHAAGIGITSGSVVIAVESDGPYRDGDVVIAKRWAPDAIAETTIRTVSGGALSARPAKGELPAYRIDETEIIGRVISAIRMFGEPH